MVLTPERVAADLGIPVDQRLTEATLAAIDWAQRRRKRTRPELLWESPSVVSGASLFAQLLYQARATPSGLAGFDEAYAPGGTTDALFRARELVGYDPVAL
jgi:hypothetical protein